MGEVDDPVSLGQPIPSGSLQKVGDVFGNFAVVGYTEVICGENRKDQTWVEGERVLACPSWEAR